MERNVNSALLEETLALKKQKNALVLAHYYVPSETQAAADFVCDSFEMAKRAAQAEEELVVICGVSFMGESAKILSPEKKVLLPEPAAGCPMAAMITPERVMAYRREHPEAAVVCYVNSSAAVKAVSDICCTSASAEKIVRSLPDMEIIFVPDLRRSARTRPFTCTTASARATTPSRRPTFYTRRPCTPTASSPRTRSAARRS